MSFLSNIDPELIQLWHESLSENIPKWFFVLEKIYMPLVSACLGISFLIYVLKESAFIKPQFTLLSFSVLAVIAMISIFINAINSIRALLEVNRWKKIYGEWKSNHKKMAIIHGIKQSIFLPMNLLSFTMLSFGCMTFMLADIVKSIIIIPPILFIIFFILQTISAIILTLDLNLEEFQNATKSTKFWMICDKVFCISNVLLNIISAFIIASAVGKFMDFKASLFALMILGILYLLKSIFALGISLGEMKKEGTYEIQGHHVSRKLVL